MKKILLLLLLLPIVTYSQIITTIAGGHGQRHFGDGGSATTAGLLYPIGVAADKLGNVYITEGKWVRMVNSSGIISTVVGITNTNNGFDGGPATASVLTWPTGIVFDDYGNYYVADRGLHIVVKITPLGKIYKIAGWSPPGSVGGGGGDGYSGDGGPATDAMLSSPYGIAIDKHGNLYVADEADNVVRKIDSLGIITTVAGNGAGAGCCSGGLSGDDGPATAAELSVPVGVAVDTVGNLFISDYGNSRIRKVNTSGIITTVVYGLANPMGIIFDNMGHCYFNDVSTDVTYLYSPSDTTIAIIAGTYGVTGYTGDGGVATTATLYMPNGLSMDPFGNIYIVDGQNSCVRKITYNSSKVTQNDLESKNIRLFPNPANINVMVISSEIISTICISNLLGQVVYSHQYNTKHVQIDVADLPKGIYFVKVNGSDVRKFVKE
jgi:hypothetical protein